MSRPSVGQSRPALAAFSRLGGALPFPALLAFLLLPAPARAELRLKRVMFLSPSALAQPALEYHPVADMDRDGLLEMAYVTGRTDSNATNPWRLEYGRFLPFNRWQLLRADTLLWPPPTGLQPASFCPFAMGDADHDGLNEILGTCLAWFFDSSGSFNESIYLCTMEQQSPAGFPDTITWLHFAYVNRWVGVIPQLPGSLDGDNLDDILAQSTTSGRLILENRGDNTHVRVWTAPPEMRGASVAFGDCDRDGRAEFMGGDNSGRVSFWESTGDDQYACVAVDTVGVPAAGNDCFFGRDVDQNGRPEFFQALSRYVGGGERFYLFMWESDADNHYVRTFVDSVAAVYAGRRSMCGDIDGDGIDEVVWNIIRFIRIYEASPGEPLHCVGSWYNDHDPTHQHGVNVNIADVNYDGYNEILVACRRKLSVLEVEAVRVLAPNQSVEYSPGDTCRISWQTFSPPRCDSVSLFLRTDTTYVLDTIAHGLAPDDTPYVWVVPDVETDSAWVMAIAYGPGWQYDESDAPLRIAPTGIAGPRVHPPRDWFVSVNPNPARDEFRVRYEVPGSLGTRPGLSDNSVMSLGIYDAGGRLVRLLADGDVAPGRYEARVPPGTLPAGVYFIRSGPSAVGLKPSAVAKVVLTE